MSEEQITLEIDGKQVKARRGAMLIKVAEEAGIHIPRFCYHEKLSIAASCRMCLVDVEKIPKPVPACATTVNDGMVVRTRSERALAAQKSVMEFLLINHPLDCPICDQGGECELQDVAMGCGGTSSRFQEYKRVAHDKNLGPLINAEMTRCIHCTRCVRFGDEIAGMRELGGIGRADYMEIGTYIDKSLVSELSGNVIDLCPVGALTSKPFRYAARAWEMTQHNAVSPHDAVGSNLHVHVRRGEVMRVVPRENDEVNENWIADRDRFSYQGLYSDDRLAEPMMKKGGKWQSVDWETALTAAAEGLNKARKKPGADKIGALASPNSTLEEFYLLQRLMRGAGSSNIDHRLRHGDFSDQEKAPLFPWLGQSLSQLEGVDAALVIGSNMRKEQPMANHRLRKAALGGAKVVVVNPVDYEFNYPLDDRLIVSPEKMVEELTGIAKALLGRGRGPGGNLGEVLRGAKPTEQQKAIAKQLTDAERPTVLLGTLATSSTNFAALRTLAGYIAQKCGASFGYLTAGANAAGAWIAGAVPHREAVGKAVESPGLDAGAMLAEPLAAYVLLGVEPELDCWDGQAALKSLKSGFVVSLAAHRSKDLEKVADVILPIGQFIESSGTLVNAEGRWQEFEGAVAPPGEARPAWKVLRVLGNLLDLDGFDYVSSAEVRDELRKLLSETAPKNHGAWDDMAKPNGAAKGIVRIGEAPIYATDSLVRRAVALQQSVDSMNGAVYINNSVADGLGLADGDSAVATQGEGKVNLKVVVDPRVADGCALIPAALPETAALGAAFGEITLAKK